MAARAPYELLPEIEQKRARGTYFDAREGDGYIYELDMDGRLLCRRRSSSKWIDGQPPKGIEVAWLKVITEPHHTRPDIKVVLGVYDDCWCEAADYRGESYEGDALAVIAWQPYEMPDL